MRTSSTNDESVSGTAAFLTDGRRWLRTLVVRAPRESVAATPIGAATIAADAPTEVTVTVVSRGKAAAHQDSGVVASLPSLLLQRDREVAHAYGAYVTPSAVLVDPDATVASELTAGAAAITALLARTVSQHPQDAADSDPPSVMANRD